MPLFEFASYGDRSITIGMARFHQCQCRDIVRNVEWLGQLTASDFRGRPNAFRAFEILVRCHEPPVELKSIFTHREGDRVLPSLTDIKIELPRNPRVNLLRPLLAVPIPLILCGPLHPPAGLRPLAINTYMETIVLRPCGMRSGPNEESPGRIDVYFVEEHRHLAGLIREVLSANELVIMGPAGIRQRLQIGAAACSLDVLSVPVGLELRSLAGSRQIPGPSVRFRLLEKMLRFNRDEAAGFFENDILSGNGLRGFFLGRCRWQQRRGNNSTE
jgi:hypothetical protein